jgi:hypothetical protein
MTAVVFAAVVAALTAVKAYFWDDAQELLTRDDSTDGLSRPSRKA